MRRLSLATLVLLVPAVAAARDPEYQKHEFDGELGISIQEGANAALIDTRYTFTPEGIDRVADDPPILRRFLYHPSSVFLHVVHDGGTREAITSARLGGELNLLGGRIYALAEGGAGRHLTIYAEDVYEYGFWFGVLRGELGFRPVDRVRVSAFYEGNPIFRPVRNDTIANQTEQGGNEQTFGGEVTVVTPNDRVYATVTGFGHIADWSYKYERPGDMTVRGLGGSVRVAILLTPQTTIQLRGRLARDHWVDGRPADTGSGYVGLDIDRNVIRGEGDVDLIYFNQARYGFRISLGGGYEGAPPLVNTAARAVISLGGGVLVRF